MHSGGGGYLGRVEAAYHEHFETDAIRASVSFVGVDPIEILLYRQTIEKGLTSSYVSLGMSRYPMVGADQALLTEDGPRAELCLTLLGQPDEVWRRLAILAAAPAVESAVHVRHGRIDLGEPWIPGSRCTGAVLTDADLMPIQVGDDVVEVLRVVPATDIELAWARVHGSEALITLWQAKGTELRDLFRAAVELG